METENLHQHLEQYRDELFKEVILHYREGNASRGQLAFERWKERLNEFLKEYLPNEYKRLWMKTYPIGVIARRNEAPLQRFMREDGEKYIAFLEDLQHALLKSYVKAGKPNESLIENDGKRQEKLVVDSKFLRSILTYRFSEEEIETFCYDHFREVYENFSRNMTKAIKVRSLIEFAERRSQIMLLYEIICRERPDILPSK